MGGKLTDRQSRCPCCGGAIDSDKIVVDLNTNTISFDGKTVRVNARTAEMAAALARRSPNVVSFDALISGIFGICETQINAKKLLTTYASFLRVAVQPLGLDVKCTPGQ